MLRAVSKQIALLTSRSIFLYIYCIYSVWQSSYLNIQLVADGVREKKKKSQTIRSDGTFSASEWQALN